MKTISWATFVFTIIVALHGYRQMSFDQAARELSSTNEEHLRKSEATYKALSEEDSLNFASVKKALSLSSQFRSPASKSDFELHIQTLSLDASSQLRALDKVYLRLIFPKGEIIDFGKDEPLSMSAGENRRLDLRVNLKEHWIQNDQLDFSLDIMPAGMSRIPVVECKTSAKNLSTYNRSYYCSIPGESTPLLSFRIGHRDMS